MTRGGFRPNSGPPADPNSARSDRLGRRFTVLPMEGRKGKAPKWPLPEYEVVAVFEDEDGKPVEVVNEATSKRWQEREAELWKWAWSTPQAVAWEKEPWRWHAVAMWVRVAVICEQPDAKAADKSSLHRFADQIGLTPAGLSLNGWMVSQDEVGAKRAEAEAGPAAEPKAKEPPRRRMRAVSGGS